MTDVFIKKGVRMVNEREDMGSKTPQKDSLYSRLCSRLAGALFVSGFVVSSLEFLNIYTWRETWIPVGASALIVATWLYLTLAMNLPNPIRATMIWTLIGTLAVLAGHYNPGGRC